MHSGIERIDIAGRHSSLSSRVARECRIVEELPGANTQGDTLEEARENLNEAVALVLEANRLFSEASIAGAEVIREKLIVSAA